MYLKKTLKEYIYDGCDTAVFFTFMVVSLLLVLMVVAKVKCQFNTSISIQSALKCTVKSNIVWLIRYIIPVFHEFGSTKTKEG